MNKISFIYFSTYESFFFLCPRILVENREHLKCFVYSTKSCHVFTWDDSQTFVRTKNQLFYTNVCINSTEKLSSIPNLLEKSYRNVSYMVAEEVFCKKFKKVEYFKEFTAFRRLYWAFDGPYCMRTLHVRQNKAISVVVRKDRAKFRLTHKAFQVLPIFVQNSGA